VSAHDKWTGQPAKSRAVQTIAVHGTRIPARMIAPRARRSARLSGVGSSW
jgi:hypothetical protein